MLRILKQYSSGIFVLVFLLTGSLSILGQTEAGQIIGKVTDANGAAIANASVSIKSVETGTIRELTTGGEGFYTATSLQPGLYDVTVKASGFADRTQRVQVTVGARRQLVVQMSVAPVTAQQEVVEGSGGIAANVASYQLADPISQRQILELPTITRDPYDLVSLSGNVTLVNPGANTIAIDGHHSNRYAINGQRPSGNNLLLDGGENVNTLSSEVGQRIPLESVQGMQVITSTFRPEYGRATGGIINVATRQGGNEFHGSLFEFHRNSEFSSNGFENNALGIPRGHLVANQFGYAVGGPLMKDRLFFFNSTEGNIVRSRENRVALVPTTQLLAASSLATQNFFNAFPLGAATTNRILTAGEVRTLIGPTTGAFAALPAATPALRLAQFNVPTDIGGGAPQDTIMTVGRVDWTLSDKSLLYGRYAFEDRDLYPGTFSFSPFSGFNTGTRERNHSALLNWTWTGTTGLSSNSKVSFNRVNIMRDFGVNGASPRLFFTNSELANIGGFPLTLPGNQPFDPLAANAFTGPLNYLNAFQDFTTTWRGQQIRFGVSYYYTQDNRTPAALQNSLAVLGGSLPQALNNLLAGQVSTFQTVIDRRGLSPGQTISLPVNPPNFSRSITAHDFAGYISHIWRAHPRVTLNWGIRYDYFGLPRTRNGQIISNYVLGAGSDIFTQVSNGSLQRIGGNDSNRLYERDFSNVAPRIGFALDLTGNGKTSLRGGYGISYERTANQALFNVFRNSPSFGFVSLTANTGTTGTIPLTTNNFGPLAGTTGSTTLPGLSVSAVERNIDTPYVHFWNLAIEREIFTNTVGSVSYAGSAGRDLFTLYNVNRPGSAAAYLGATNPTARLNPQYGPINFLTSDGQSNYHALIAELNNSSWRRIGLQFSARYRYSKALDNISTTLGGMNSFTSTMLSPFNPNLNYGPSDFDVRHRFIGSFNWEVPFDKIGDRVFGGTGTRIAQQVFGGWEITGIIHARSGLPFTLFNCAGAATAEAPCPRVVANGLSADVPDGDDLQADATIPNRFVFLDPAGRISPITPGAVFNPFPANTTTRNFFRGPRFWNLDAGLHKRFRFTEDMSLQLRAELYNVFNRAQLFIPGTAIDVSSTNYIPAFRSGRRHLQLAVKFLF
jgi:hypothetical protein